MTFMLVSESDIKHRALRSALSGTNVGALKPGATRCAQPVGAGAAFKCIDDRMSPYLQTEGCRDKRTALIAIENYLEKRGGESVADCAWFDVVAVRVVVGLFDVRFAALEPVAIPERFNSTIASMQKQWDSKDTSMLLGCVDTFGSVLHAYSHQQCPSNDWFLFVGHAFDRCTQIVNALRASLVPLLATRARLHNAMHVYDDFPQRGVTFSDVLPLLEASRCDDLVHLVRHMLESAGIACDSFSEHYFVAGLESRGLLFGTVIARALGATFVAIRKHGKLPHDTSRPLKSVTYTKEYGTDTLEVQPAHLPCGTKQRHCLLVDDVLATGGSLVAAAQLMEQCGVSVAAALVVDHVEPLLRDAKKRCGEHLPLLLSLF